MSPSLEVCGAPLVPINVEKWFVFVVVGVYPAWDACPGAYGWVGWYGLVNVGGCE
jgi:hypothetical protein